MNIKFLQNEEEDVRIDREKITEYLLCESHPDGRSKAAFFTRFEFTIEKWEVLAESLRKQGKANPIIKTVRSEYGVRYCVDGPLETPCGDRPTIRTVWIIEEGTRTPRLVTAYPLQEKL